MMELKDKVFEVRNLPLYDLEEHLNEAAQDDWVLYSIYQSRDTNSLPSFTVIMHRCYDWKAHEAWKSAQKFVGGHANE